MNSIKKFLFGDTRVFIKMKRWVALLVFAIFSVLLARVSILTGLIGSFFWVGIPWFFYLLIRKKL